MGPIPSSGWLRRPRRPPRGPGLPGSMGFLLALSILSSVVPVAHSASGAKQSILDEKTHQEVDLLAANALASAESVLPSLPQLPDFLDPRKSFEGLGDESFEGMGLAKKEKQGQGAG